MVQQRLGYSERLACRAIGQSRSSQRYRAWVAPQDSSLIRRMEEIKQQNPRWGYRRVAAVMRSEGWSVSDKRLYRIYRSDGCHVEQPIRKRKAAKKPVKKVAASRENEVWACDTTTDHDERGRPLVWLAAIDEFSRHCRVLSVHRNVQGSTLVNEFDMAFRSHALPSRLRCDNNRLWHSSIWRKWLAKSSTSIRFIERGCPWQNGHIESFFGRLRNELLQSTEFTTLNDARTQAAIWLSYYNSERPHGSLGMVPPDTFVHEQ